MRRRSVSNAARPQFSPCSGVHRSCRTAPISTAASAPRAGCARAAVVCGHSQAGGLRASLIARPRGAPHRRIAAGASGAHGSRAPHPAAHAVLHRGGRQSECAEGYEGVLCATCSRGFYGDSVRAKTHQHPGVVTKAYRDGAGPLFVVHRRRLFPGRSCRPRRLCFLHLVEPVVSHCRSQPLA